AGGSGVRDPTARCDQFRVKKVAKVLEPSVSDLASPEIRPKVYQCRRTRGSIEIQGTVASRTPCRYQVAMKMSGPGLATLGCILALLANSTVAAAAPARTNFADDSVATTLQQVIQHS